MSQNSYRAWNDPHAANEDQPYRTMSPNDAKVLQDFQTDLGRSFVWAGDGWYAMRCGGVLPIIKHPKYSIDSILFMHTDGRMLLAWDRETGRGYDGFNCLIDLVGTKLAEIDEEMTIKIVEIKNED